mmetsp:Transcript_53672/g.117047  ORF Transcript_53672/g.117047 Transcript_53672/m.117047 type:complete len:320 (-) Transcript_53672:410-1369(-)
MHPPCSITVTDSSQPLAGSHEPGLHTTCTPAVSSYCRACRAPAVHRFSLRQNLCPNHHHGRRTPKREQKRPRQVLWACQRKWSEVCGCVGACSSTPSRLQPRRLSSMASVSPPLRLRSQLPRCHGLRCSELWCAAWCVTNEQVSLQPCFAAPSAPSSARNRLRRFPLHRSPRHRSPLVRPPLVRSPLLPRRLPFLRFPLHSLPPFAHPRHDSVPASRRRRCRRRRRARTCVQMIQRSPRPPPDAVFWAVAADGQPPRHDATCADGPYDTLLRPHRNLHLRQSRLFDAVHLKLHDYICFPRVLDSERQSRDAVLQVAPGC